MNLEHFRAFITFSVYFYIFRIIGSLNWSNHGTGILVPIAMQLVPNDSSLFTLWYDTKYTLHCCSNQQWWNTFMLGKMLHVGFGENNQHVFSLDQDKIRCSGSIECLSRPDSDADLGLTCCGSILNLVLRWASAEAYTRECLAWWDITAVILLFFVIAEMKSEATNLDLVLHVPLHACIVAVLGNANRSMLGRNAAYGVWWKNDA